MRERFADSTLRAKIIAESDAAIKARFNGASSIVLNETGRKLSDIMTQSGAKSPGEAVVKVLETEFPSAILSFGREDDLVKVLQYPSAAIACDCGAWTEKRAHPRGFGTFPRILGHYVRETHVLTWEEGVRKMSALPASITGMVDRGFITPGMAADIVVFDTATVIDHATYDHPDLKSEGIRVVLVNGVVALRDGAVTGARGGAALRRTSHMPSRAMNGTAMRGVQVRPRVGKGTTSPNDSLLAVSLSQGAGSRTATGSVRFRTGTTRFESTSLGLVQTAADWASVTGWGRTTNGALRPFTLIVEGNDPMATGDRTVGILSIEGENTVRMSLGGRLTIAGASASAKQ